LQSSSKLAGRHRVADNVEAFAMAWQ